MDSEEKSKGGGRDEKKSRKNACMMSFTERREKETVWSVKGFVMTLQQNKKNRFYSGECVDNMISV